MKLKISLFAIVGLFVFLSCKVNDDDPVEELRTWLELAPTNRPLLESMSFAKESITLAESNSATALLLADKQQKMLEDYGTQWNDRLIVYDKKQMPFYYHIFGTEPSDGRSLFISLHGGGGAEAAVNDQQYLNQKHLYDETMRSLEGVYLAARAPGNTWDLWHKKQIDEFLNVIIQLAVITENVNPNKVYILGYSAGGDGLYQLAPRMADRWAAASMMAGHPGDASPLGLRNLPFSIHVGALDSAYHRNSLAQKWGVSLDGLRNEDSQGYVHQVQLHEGLGHWMKLEDAVALPWMKNFLRNPIPQRVVWKQDNRHHTSFYWIKTPENEIVTGGEVITTYSSINNEINIEENYSETIELLLNDEMLNLDDPVTIKYNNEAIYQGTLKRTILNIYENLMDKGDENLAFPCVVSVKDKQIVSN